MAGVRSKEAGDRSKEEGGRWQTYGSLEDPGEALPLVVAGSAQVDSPGDVSGPVPV